MLSHVKQRNSIFKRIKKNINILYVPQCKKQSFSEDTLLEKIYNVLFYSLLVYIYHLNILSHVKYRKCNFTLLQKYINMFYVPQCYKQNCSENNLLEKIYNALFYTLLEYIHQNNMLSHVKYRNSIFKRIEKNLNIVQAHQC